MWYSKTNYRQIKNRLSKNRSKTHAQKCCTNQSASCTELWHGSEPSVSISSMAGAWCRNEGVHEHLMNFFGNIQLLGPQFFSKINLSTPPIWVGLVVFNGLLPRHLKLQNDGTRKHLKFGRWKRYAELGIKRRVVFGVFGVSSGSGKLISIGWVHPLGVLLFHTSGIDISPYRNSYLGIMRRDSQIVFFQKRVR